MARRGNPDDRRRVARPGQGHAGKPPAPAEAHNGQACGALLVDIRGDDRRRAGLIPGPSSCPATVWNSAATPRLSGGTPPLPAGTCTQQGYQSSLAAATLRQFGLIHASDLDGGFTAWAAVGLPVIAPPTAGHERPGNPHPDGSPR